MGATLVLDTARERDRTGAVSLAVGFPTVSASVFESVVRDVCAASRKMAVAWLVTAVPAGGVASALGTTNAAKIAALIRRRPSLDSTHERVRRSVRGRVVPIAHCPVAFAIT